MLNPKMGNSCAKRLPSNGAVGVAIETTARMLAERTAGDTEERMRFAIEAAGIGTFEIDVASERVRYSAVLSRMLGFPEVAETQVQAAFARVHRDDFEHVRTLYNQALSPEGDGELNMEFRFVHPGGDVHWMRWNGRRQLRDAVDGLNAVKIIGACIDITEQKRHEAHIHLLMREVNHRSKNLLGLVMAIARHTLRTERLEAVDTFQERIHGLAASQDLLVRSEWKGSNLEDLIRSQLSHFSGLFGARITWKGPRLILSATAAETLGMVLHELATNAGSMGR